MADSRALLVGPFPGWEELDRDLQAAGWSVERVESGAEAYRTLQSDERFLVAVLPTKLRDGPADNLILKARRAGTRADFVLLGDVAREERAALLAEGAEEIFEPDVTRERLMGKLVLLRARRRLIDDLGIVVRDPVMLELFERVLRIAPLKVNALITGESGTGKEMLAQGIHRASDRRDRPFVAVNVGALPDSLLESELFGHEKGAFTSADSRRIGRFEMANAGTLFLDEIGEMSLRSQVNLLRVLEEERFLRVGGSEAITVDVRVVAATNRNLEDLVREGKFRRDLYYRLKVVQFEVPPLRNRREEIPILARELAANAARQHQVRFPGFTKSALEALSAYEWPGNVRELRNLIDGLVALRPETPVQTSDLPPYVVRPSEAERPLPSILPDRNLAEREFIVQSLLAIRSEIAALKELISGRSGSMPLAPYGDLPEGRAVYPTRAVQVERAGANDTLSIKEVERRTIERALRDSAGNRRLAARALGMSERTLYRRIKEFGLEGDA